MNQNTPADFGRYIPRFLIHAPIPMIQTGSFRLLPRWLTLLMSGCVAMGLSGRTPATGALPPRTDAPDVTGVWTLCKSEFAPARKNFLRRRPRAWSSFVANMCTDVVFQANGTGSAGQFRRKMYDFTWQQHAGTVTVTYLEPAVAAAATWVSEGTYDVLLSTRLTSTELVLSNTRERHFLIGQGRTK